MIFPFKYIYIYIYMCVCVYVTVFFFFFFFFFFENPKYINIYIKLTKRNIFGLYNLFPYLTGTLI
jgi:hypothetical protein